MILDGFLKQRMRTDDDLCVTLCDAVISRASRLCRDAAGQPRDRDAQWLEPALKVVAVLLCEQLRRGHDGNLVTGADSTQCSTGSYHGFAAPDIPLHQTHHRMRLCEVAIDLVQRFALVARECEAQLVEKLLQQVGVRRHRQAGFFVVRELNAPQAQMMREYFFEHESPLVRMLAVAEVL